MIIGDYKVNIEEFINDYIKKHGFVSKDKAINQEMINLEMFDEPIVGYADAKDRLFYDYAEKKEVTQNKFMVPTDWFPDAKTVISVFFPFSQSVKKSNSENMDAPSLEWLHSRIEGQAIIKDCTKALVDYINSKGYKTLAPCLDNRIYAQLGSENNKQNSAFTSNWSDRHVAFAAGLGTFGLSKGLITKKGVAGRFTSVITNYYHTPTERDYSDIYGYCNMCGKCIRNCPASAITKENGKQHYPCKLFLNKVLEINKPRYGCGKCQVSVPCQDRIPVR